LLGNSIKKLGERREDLVLSTKIYFRNLSTAPNAVGTSRKRVHESVD